MEKKLLPEHLIVRYDSHLGGKDHSVCMNCSTRDDLPIDKKRQDVDIMAFVELHKDCKPLYQLFPKDNPVEQYAYQSVAYGTKLTFKQLCEVVLLDIVNIKHWVVNHNNWNYDADTFFDILTFNQVEFEESKLEQSIIDWNGWGISRKRS